jgi:flavin reductase (DIM6/NTAB) family NADH-FMN oxidoreductase RutF
VTPGAGGAPLLPAAAQFECALEAVYPGGDHQILLGRVLRSAGASARRCCSAAQARRRPAGEPALAG